MIVKVNSQFLDFNGDIDIQRQVMSIEKLDTVDSLVSLGDYSYNFDIPDTQHNRDVLMIKSIDQKDDLLFTGISAEILSDSGNPIAYGSIIVTDSIKISCSFVSGNNTFLSLINGNIRDVILSEYDIIELDESIIVDSWTKDYGIVFPIIDRGGLSNRKDAFLKFEKIIPGLKTYIVLNDFQPFFYLKHAVSRLLVNAGLKIDGDLISDPTYNSLITTNNDDSYNQVKEKQLNVFVGKTLSQNITDSGFTKVSFDDVTNDPYFNSIFNSWDLINNRWTALFSVLLSIDLTFTTSDKNKLIQFQLRRDGIDSYDTFERGDRLSFHIPDLNPERDFNVSKNSYIELWAKVDSTTPGNVNLVIGSINIEVTKSITIFAQSLLPNQSSKDFLKDIFRLFNVVCTFDTFSKTIHTKFFNNIIKSDEQDLSKFVHDYESETGFDIVGNYAKENLINYANTDEQSIVKYNNTNKIPYGSSDIIINNKFLKDKAELFNINYVPVISKNYPVFGLQLIKLDFVKYEIIDSPALYEAFTTVTDLGGLAAFNPGANTVTNNLFKGTATGIFQNIVITEKVSSNQVLAIHVPNVSLKFPIRFTESFTFGPLGPPASYLINISQSSIPGYNGDWEPSGFPSVDRNIVSIAVFARFQDGTDIDLIKQGLSFGHVQGNDSLTLQNTFYSGLISILNNPVKMKIQFLMSEKEYLNFDFLRPVRIKTKEFNSLFYCQKQSGYKNSWTPFEMELIKL